MLLSVKIGFHESTVNCFFRNGENIELELEGAVVDGEKKRVNIQVVKVFRVEVDGEFSIFSLMAEEDGEVILLEMSRTDLIIIIEWHNFSTHSSLTKSYKISGEKINVSCINESGAKPLVLN